MIYRFYNGHGIRFITNKPKKRGDIGFRVNGKCYEANNCQLDAYGYPYRIIKGKKTRVNRLVYSLWRGEPTEDYMICHSCDNRKCIRDTHLWKGTTKDNTRDRQKKSRQARGERQGSARLTGREVKEIRSSKCSQRRLAETFGVSQHTIWAIINKIGWKHIK